MMENAVDQCTIYSLQIDYAKVLQIVRNVVGIAELKIDGDKSNWASLKVITPKSSLTLNSKVREKPGDDFSKLIMFLLKK